MKKAGSAAAGIAGGGLDIAKKAMEAMLSKLGPIGKMLETVIEKGRRGRPRPLGVHERKWSRIVPFKGGYDTFSILLRSYALCSTTRSSDLSPLLPSYAPDHLNIPIQTNLEHSHIFCLR